MHFVFKPLSAFYTGWIEILVHDELIFVLAYLFVIFGV